MPYVNCAKTKQLINHKHTNKQTNKQTKKTPSILVKIPVISTLRRISTSDGQWTSVLCLKKHVYLKSHLSWQCKDKAFLRTDQITVFCLEFMLMSVCAVVRNTSRCFSWFSCNKEPWVAFAGDSLWQQAATVEECRQAECPLHFQTTSLDNRLLKCIRSEVKFWGGRLMWTPFLVWWSRFRFRLLYLCQGPTDMGFFGLMLMLISGSKKILISDISADILYWYFKCGYQIHVTKMCNGGWISNKLN